ncbi:MAG TPA: hypothetical protein VKB18_02685 [Gemmatimonadota bacterium]|nr:hypothetical protein [Gemmatimonadota bacterium]
MSNRDHERLSVAPDHTRRTVRALAALLLGAAAWACGSTFGLNRVPVPDNPTEATLSDFRTSDVRDASAFNVLTGRTVRTDLSASWDFLYYVLPDGTAQLRPRDMVLGGSSASGLRHSDQTFDGITDAPDGGYTTDQPVVIAQGDVLTGVSRSDPGYSTRCRHFFKMEVESIDAAAGTVTFRILINPNCEQRILVPGQGGS